MENNTQKISLKFDLYTLIIGILVGLSFIMWMIHLIVWQSGFIAYQRWLLRYLFLVLLVLIFLVARQLKNQKLLLVATTFLVAHSLIFPVGAVSGAGFNDFATQAFFILILLFVALILLIVLAFIKPDAYEKIDKFYAYVVAALYALIGIVYLLDTFINGFRDYGDFRWTRAFFALGGVFYYAALVGVFVMPLVDSGALAKMKKDIETAAAKATKKEEKPQAEPAVEKVKEEPKAEKAPEAVTPAPAPKEVKEEAPKTKEPAPAPKEATPEVKEVVPKAKKAAPKTKEPAPEPKVEPEPKE